MHNQRTTPTQKKPASHKAVTFNFSSWQVDCQAECNQPASAQQTTPKKDQNPPEPTRISPATLTFQSQHSSL